MSRLRVGGSVILWTTGEWSDLAKLRAGFEYHGWQKMAPEARTPAAALRDALEEMFPRKEMLIRPLNDRSGFSVVKETRGQDHNGYENLHSARVDKDLRITFAPYDWAKANDLAERYNRQMGMVKGEAVTSALIDVLNALGGTRLRPKGGVYWLADDRLDQFRNVIQVVEGAGQGNSVYVIRHDMDPDSIRAVKDAIILEVSAAAKALDDEVTRGELGEKALRLRRDLAESLRDKIKEYEEILGLGLNSLHEAIDVAEQAAAKAILLASCAGEPLHV